MHRLYIDIYILGNIHWHACVRTYVHAYLHTQTYRHPKIYACVHPYAHMPNTYTHACIVCTGRCSLPRHIATMHCLQDFAVHAGASCVRLGPRSIQGLLDRVLF